MNNFPYKTFGGWVRSFSLKISDLTEDELKEAREEFSILSDPNSCIMVDDSILQSVRRRIMLSDINKVDGQ